MKVVADTSWLYALLDGQDAHHQKARDEMKPGATVHVPHAVLVETLGLIQVRAGRNEAAAKDALEAMRQTAGFVLSDPPHDHEAAANIWDTHDKLSYVDASAIAAARRLGVSLLSYDKTQKKAHRSGRP